MDTDNNVTRSREEEGFVMSKNNSTATIGQRVGQAIGLPSTKYGLAAGITYAVMTSPVAAWAEETQAGSTFNSIRDTISTGLQAVGAAMVVFGAVTIGMNVSGAAQGNGGAISSGIATMVGGAVIAIAATLFKTSVNLAI